MFKLFRAVARLTGNVGVGVLGAVLLVAAFAFLVALALGFNMFVVALVWNWLGLHSVFGVASTLGFWSVALVALAMLFLGV
jgi:hypothetical protein